jgi:hypothetical protein
MAGIRFEEAAQVGDVYVQHPCVVTVLCLPDTVEQLFTRYHRAGPGHEQRQDPASEGR